ncbi:MAG TPA: arylsulfatase [Bryobacteraceae bacterium]|nr:arylsulfatase [Bryobacteraceae bacterium]
MQTGRRGFLVSLGGITLGRAAAKRPPNIIWIMADDLGYGDLGCYGQNIIQTPNLDRLASEGTRFTDAYAGCTVCAPSRSVLMTGYHMGHTSVRSNPGGVPLLSSDVTIAERLKPAGYRTGGFGKWGLGDIGTDGVPWKHGFDEFSGYFNQVHAHWFYPEFLYQNDKRYPLRGNTDARRTTYSHDVIAEKGLQFIRRNKDAPFFCYLAYTLPHLELLVPEDSLRPYRDRIVEEKPYVDPKKHYADQPEARAAYAGMVSRLDRDVGRVLALLTELRLADNTVVFFTSDNGSAVPLWGEDYFRSTAGLRGHKQNLYEGGIRVPMIARWPQRIAGGAVSNHPWAFWDAMPTLCDIADCAAVPGIDGRSVLPALLGRPQKPAEFLYWELPRYNGKTGRFADEMPMQAVRTGDWKAVRPRPNGPLELYNLRADPRESTNVAEKEQAAIARIEEYLRTARTPPRPQVDPPQDFRKAS